MEGFLRAMVLKAISEKECNGYALMKSLAECTGRKPSPGSIYPLLSDLEKEGLISSKAIGKGKTYSITAKGKKGIKDLALQKQHLLIHHMEFITHIASITGKNDARLKEALKREPSKRFIAANLPPYADIQRQVMIIGTSKDADEKTEKTKKALEQAARKLTLIAKERRR